LNSVKFSTTSKLCLLENIQAVDYVETTVGNNGLLLLLTTSNVDLSLTCHCCVFCDYEEV